MLRLIPVLAVVVAALVLLRDCGDTPTVEPHEPGAAPTAGDGTPAPGAELVPPREGETGVVGRVGAADAPEAEAPPTPAEDEARGPVLFAGRVVDGDGAPIAGASIRVSRYEADTSGFGAIMVQYQELRALAGQTDEAGRFEIRAPSAATERGTEGGAPAQVDPLLAFEGDRYQLVPAHPGHARHAGVEVDAPRTDLELVLPRAGSLEVSVVHAALELADRSYVLVSRPGEQRDVGQVTYAFDAGVMKRGGLEPGTYDVHIVGALHRRPYLTVEGVRVVADDVTRDPRLTNLDLRRFVQPVRVTVVDELGAPAVGVTVFAEVRSEGRGLETGADGSVEFLVGEDGLDVLVRHEGYRTLRREGLTEDTTLQLQRPLELVVRREPPLSAAIQVAVWGENRPVERGTATLAVGDAEVSIPIDEPGRYQLIWSLAIPDLAGSTWYLPPSVRSEQVVTVEASTDGTSPEVWLSIDPAELARLESKAADLRTQLERRDGESDADHRARALRTMLEALTADGAR